MAKKKTPELEGKVRERKFNNENYDYDSRTVYDVDHFIFKRGKESITAELRHPHYEELQESNPRFNEETIFGGDMKYGSQHTIWDKPLGRSKRPIIDNLYATEGAKADVGTALGVIANHSMRRFGQIPEASPELSQHSSKVAEKIHERAKSAGMEGLGSTPRRPTNEITKQRGAETAMGQAKLFEDSPNYTAIHPDKIAEGSRTIRGLFAGRHLNKAQFHQEELPLEK